MKKIPEKISWSEFNKEFEKKEARKEAYAEDRNVEAEKKTEEKEDNPLVSLNKAQLVVCGIFLIIIILLKLLGSDCIAKIKGITFDESQDVFSFEVAIESFKSLTSDFAKAVMTPINSINITNDKEKEQGDSAEDIDINSKASEINMGIGGDQNDDDRAASGAPPTNASLAPYYVTAKPVIPVVGNISSAFGYRDDPFTDENKFHGGLDFSVSEGTRIASAYSGRVKTAVNSETGYGNYLILEHSDGMETLYAHCKELMVEEGENIRAGEIIALSGNTGKSTGPHLHFEIRFRGVKYDPAAILELP